MIAEQGRVPNRYSETRVYLDSCRNDDLCGYLEHPARGKMWRFNDTVTFVALHERIFGQANHPQSSYTLRTMEDVKRGEKEIEDVETVDKASVTLSEKPTFIINVQYRQNATWQGTIKWVDRNVEKHFRSALELLKLMDDAVGGEETPW